MHHAVLCKKFPLTSILPTVTLRLRSPPVISWFSIAWAIMSGKSLFANFFFLFRFSVFIPVCARVGWHEWLAWAHFNFWVRLWMGLPLLWYDWLYYIWFKRVAPQLHGPSLHTLSVMASNSTSSSPPSSSPPPSTSSSPSRTSCFLHSFP